MEQSFSIGILGIGGVGGYFGALLAAHYDPSEQVSIIFIARPATAQVIRENGLTIISPAGEQVLYPRHVTTGAGLKAPLDVLICATKSYDLDAALAPLKESIAAHTLILPLLNGVDAAERIRRLYPGSEVIDGCVYVNARRTAPGVIRKTALKEQLIFGAKQPPAHDLERLQQLFRAAGIDSTLSDHIERDIWTKYIFITVLATATSYYDLNIHHLLADPEPKKTLLSLLDEAVQVALAQGIDLPADIAGSTLQKLESLPPEAMSSMHSDFLSGGRTEYPSLTGYIVQLGDELGIDTPVYDRMLATFEDRSARMAAGRS